MRFLAFVLVFLTVAARAAGVSESTFVGNGGNLGDVEILVTRREIEEAMSRIVERKSSSRALCTCTDEYENHPICAPLRGLDKPQVEFCSGFLSEHAERIKGRIAGPEAVEIQWTHQRIDVASHAGARAVDAVASSQRKAITINLDRYMEMKNHERMLLLMHELLHFEEHSGKALVDEGPAGPFAGNEGGRQLINAVAAAATLEAADQSVLRKYAHVLDRPQNWRKYWIDLDGGSGQVSKLPSGAYGIERFHRSALDFRAYLTPSWGVVLAGRTQTGADRILTSVDISEKILTYAIGATYKWIVFHDPLAYFGQSHLVFKGLIGYQNATLSVTDGDSVVEDKASGLIYEISAGYYLPVAWNFWFFLGASYEIQSHRYERIPVTYDMNKSFFSLGVSYGF